MPAQPERIRIRVAGISLIKAPDGIAQGAGFDFLQHRHFPTQQCQIGQAVFQTHRRQPDSLAFKIFVTVMIVNKVTPDQRLFDFLLLDGIR